MKPVWSYDAVPCSIRRLADGSAALAVCRPVVYSCFLGQEPEPVYSVPVIITGDINDFFAVGKLRDKLLPGRYSLEAKLKHLILLHSVPLFLYFRDDLFIAIIAKMRLGRKHRVGKRLEIYAAVICNPEKDGELSQKGYDRLGARSD